MAEMALHTGGPSMIPQTANKYMNDTTSTGMVNYGGNVYKY